MLEEDKINPPVVYWWLHMGENIKGDILVLSSSPSLIVYSLVNISNKIYVLNDSYNYERDNVVSLTDLDLKENMFDGVIADCLVENDQQTHMELIKTCNSLKSEGTVCFAEYNKRRFSNKLLLKDSFGLLFNKKHLKQGYDSYENHGLYLAQLIYSTVYDNLVYESRTRNVYYTNKNTFLFKERVKRIIMSMGPSLALSNSFIVVMNKGNSSNTLCDDLSNELNEHGILFQHGNIAIVKAYYKYGKILISLSSGVARVPEYIIVMCTDMSATEQRRNEYDVVSKLSKYDDIQPYLPKIYGEYNLYGIPYYVIQEFQGLTVDIDNKNLSKMMDNAYSILLIFLGHKDNAYQENRKMINDRMLRYHNRVKQRTSTSHEKIDELNILLVNQLNEHDIPIMPMHGDYKIENVVLDPVNYSVVGLIDFELADIKGYPLIDLFYLILYSVCLQKECRFLYAYSLLVTDNLDQYYKDLINDYCDKAGIQKNMYKYLLGLFFMHHFSERYLFDMDIDIPGEIELLDKALDNILTTLKVTGK